MFKKLILVLLLTLAHVLPSQAETIVKKLPSPVLSGGQPLMEVLKNRHSAREFSSLAIDDQTLSEILWSAWGISHGDKRTIPTSMNKQNLNVYAIMQEGAWRYDASTNSLQQISSEDLRPLLAQQSYVLDAPLTLVFTGTDKANSLLHAGSAYQNVGLYATSKGLNNVVRAYFEKQPLAKALGVEADEIIISQTIGWPK